MALINRGSTILTGASADRPAAGNAGLWFYDTDKHTLFQDDGSNWIQMLGQMFTIAAGGNISSGETGERFPIIWEISNAASVGSGQATSIVAVPFDCTLVRVMFHVKEFGTDTFDQAQVYKNDVSIYDSGTGLGLTNTQIHVADVDVDFDQAERYEVSIKKSGTNAAMFIDTLGIFIRR